MSRTDVLIVDREEEQERGYSLLLEEEGWTVTFASNETEALNHLHQGAFEVVLLDSGTVSPPLPFVESLRREAFPVSIIVTASNPSIDRATRLVRGGAHDYVGKPFPLLRLTSAIEEAAEVRSKDATSTRSEDLDRAEEEVATLQRKHDQVRDELKKLLLESKKLTEERNGFALRATELEEALETARAGSTKQAELEETLAEARSRREEIASRYAESQKQVEKTREEAEEARQEADDARQQAKEAQQQAEKARQESEEALERTKAAEEQAREDRERLLLQEKERARLETEFEESRKEAAASSHEGEELEAALEKIERLTQEVEEERGRVGELENELLELGESLTELQGDQLQALKDHEELQQKITDTERLLREEKNRRIEAENALEDFHGQAPPPAAAADDSAVQALERERDGLLGEIETCRQQQQELQEELDSLRGRLAEVENDKRSAEAMSSALESQALQLREELERTKGEVDKEIESHLNKEREEVEEEASQLLQYLKSILDEMFCGYLIIDESERIVTLNPQVGTLFTCPAESLAEQNLDDLPALSHLKGLFREFKESGEEVEEREVALEITSERTIPVLLKFLKANYADKHSHLVVIQDISEIAEFKQKTEYLSGLEDFGTLAVTHMEQIKETLFAIRMTVENLKLLLRKQAEPFSLAEETLRSIDEVVPLLQMIYDSYYAAEESLEWS